MQSKMLLFLRYFHLSAVLLPLISLNLHASLNSKYYPKDFVEKIESDSIDDEELKKELFKILSETHFKQKNKRDLIRANCRSPKCYSQVKNLTYKKARQILFGHLFIEKDSWRGFFVRDRYCNKIFDQDDGIAPLSIPDPRRMNCEHSWPQSKFSKKFSKNLQKTDLHHLYPVMSKVNSSRGNKPFSEVTANNEISFCKQSSKGDSVYNGQESFEPPRHHRGDLARAMFYFSIRYKSKISESAEFFYKKWHREDPVDHAERWRNNEIYKVQKNRNPFIDRPELVEKINDF